MAKPPDPDAALMLLAKDGDMRAFEQLVEKYKQPIVNLMFRMLHDLSEAEDLAQTVFVRVYQSASRYQVSAKFSTWIFTIARHVCLNEIRRRSRHPAESIESSLPESDEPATRQFEDHKTFTPPEAFLHANSKPKSSRRWINCPKNSAWPSSFAARMTFPTRKSPASSASPFPPPSPSSIAPAKP